MRAALSKYRHKRQVIDILFLGVSFYFAVLISHKEMSNNQLLIAVILMFIWYFTSKYTKLYDDFRTTTFIEELLVVIPNILFQLISTGFIYFIINDHAYVRTTTLFYILLLSLSLIIKKYFLKQWHLYNWVKGKDIKNLLIIGSGEQGMAFYNTALNNKQFGYNPIGFIEEYQPKHLNGKYKGTTKDLEKIIEEYKVDEIIISLAEYDAEKVKKILVIADKYAIRTKIIPEYLQFFQSSTRWIFLGIYQLLP